MRGSPVGCRPHIGLGPADRLGVDPSLDDGWQTLDDDGRDFLAQALSEIGDRITDGEPRPGLGPGHRLDDPATSPARRRTDTPTGEGRLSQLLQLAVANGASDLHLSVDRPPHLRVGGILAPMADHPPLAADELDHLLRAVLDPDQQRELAADGDLDLGLTLPDPAAGTGLRRFRASLFRHSGTLAAAIRIVPDRIPGLDALGLPPVATELANRSGGLVLVTGPTGSGKSTTLAAMVETINHRRAAHIVTIEDPIEYRYTPAHSLIQQREIGADARSFAGALRRALRQDPDVILIGELRDLETIRIALTAAETGHLVFATLHSADTTSAITRIIDVFPAEQQTQIRSQLALSIEGCLSQRLLPATGGGLVPVTEALVATSAVRSLIRESKLHQLRSVLETGAEMGMHTFEQSLATQVRGRRLDPAVVRGATRAPAAVDPVVGQ